MTHLKVLCAVRTEDTDGSVRSKFAHKFQITPLCAGWTVAQDTL